MNFVIVSYYTRGTRYQQCAQRLKESLIRLNEKTILFNIQGVENLGTWQKNVHYKARFILEMLEKYKIPVLYVDADAVFHKYPKLFDRVDCDVAAYFYEGRQLDAATLYFANTLVARDVLRAWIQKNTEKTGAIDQDNLQEVCELLEDDELMRLPPEYCKIFDLMPEVTDPVIEQFQASRELRLDPFIVARERAKYAWQWANGYQRSACAQPLSDYIRATAAPGQNLLDIGCGDGFTVRSLRSAGFPCYGVDITIVGQAGIQHPEGFCPFYEAPVWQMPFPDTFFDYTFSTDVLEHLPPEMVDAAIREIYRITKQRTFHCIATWPHEREGVDLHLSVHPIEWWQERFALLNFRGIDMVIVSRDEFLKTAQGGLKVNAG